MFRTVLAAIPLVLLVVLAGCQKESGELLSAPAGANAPTIEAACDSAPDICELIEALFPEPGLEHALLTQFGNIARQLERGETADAVGKTFDKIQIELDHYENGRLEDPAGGDPPTIEEALTELLNAQLEFVGLLPVFPEGGLGDEDFAWQFCEAGVKCVFETESQFAGFSGTFTEPTLVTIFRLPDDPGPFVEFFDNYPLFFDFSATSLSDAMGPSAGLAPASLAEPATVAVCVVDPPDPLAPPEEVLPNLALGHLIEGEEGPEVEILPDAPPGDFALDCAGASTTPPPVIGSLRWWGEGTAAAFEPVSGFLVSPLLANPGERRGLITAFSPVGAVDTTSGGEEGGPTTTTLILDDQLLDHGSVAIATATVDPAPGNELAGTVNFVIAPGTVNQQIIPAPLNDGEASITIQCDALDQISSEADAEIGRGSFFIRADFPGAGDFEASMSSEPIISCLSPIG